MATKFSATTIEVAHQVTLHVQECIECGVVFGVPDAFDARRRQDKATFYCPNGHRHAYMRSDTDKLRDEAAQLRESLAGERRRTEAALREVERERANVEWERKRHAATKGQLTKTKRRVEAGVCIHCHRSFVQLSRHMQTRHVAVLGAEAEA